MPYGTAIAPPSDVDSWRVWWSYNRHGYLDLRRRVHEGTGLDGDWIDFPLSSGASPHGSARPHAPKDKVKQQVVRPLIVRLLETETNNDVVTACLIALGKIGESPNPAGESELIPLFAGFLSASQQEVAETAALSLGILGDVRALPLLMDLALDSEAGQAAVGGGAVPTRTRAFAVYGMGLLGEASAEADVQRRIVRTLISILESDDEARADVPVAAALSLGVISLPWSTPEEPVGLWRDRASVLRYLHGRMEPEAAQEAAFGWREVRAQVPLTMARLLTSPGDADKAGMRAADRLHSVISDQLLTMLDGKKGEPDESVRQSAIIGLGMITPAGASASDRDRRSRQIFLGLRRVSERAKAPHSRGLALMALATMGSRPGRDRQPLGLALEIQGVLVDAVRHGKGHQAPWAGLALGILADGLQARGQALDADSLAALRKAFDESRRQHEVGAYGIALGLAGDRQAEARLTENLQRFQSDGARGEMALALGLLGAAGSQAEIDRVLTQSKFRPALLREVAVTLGIMGDKKVVHRLVDMLRQSRVQSAQAAVAGALGRIGDASAIAPLLVMAKDSGVTDGARAFAVAALGTTCDRRNFGFSARFRRHANYRVAVDTLNDPRRNGFLDIL